MVLRSMHPRVRARHFMEAIVMSQQTSIHGVSQGQPESYRLLSRKLARELTDQEINAVSGGTTSRTRVSAAQESTNIVIVDDADA